MAENIKEGTSKKGGGGKKNRMSYSGKPNGLVEEENGKKRVFNAM